MALLAHYRCDEQDNADNVLHDVSGHANNHDAPLTIFNTGGGFDHLRMDATGNIYSSSEPGNPADFRLQGEMTVMCWIQRTALSGSEYVIGYGDTTHETQAENHQWNLYTAASARFGMWWEHTAGVDVVALSPANALDPAGDGFGGQTRCLHIACIRTISGTATVKFVVNGVDLAADVSGLTPPDGGTYPEAGPWLFTIPRQTNIGRINAQIGDIRVYDSAESVPTILGIYNAEKARHENATRVGRPFSMLGDQYERSGPQGSLYLPRHMATELDPIVRPNSGWSGVRP
jgi:hypothetical protein